MMIFSKITIEEIEAFFSKAYGYKTITNSTGTYIYSLRKSGYGFIFLRPKKKIWRPILFLSLWLDRKLLTDLFPLEWAKFILHTEINRAISKQSKTNKS